MGTGFNFDLWDLFKWALKMVAYGILTLFVLFCLLFSMWMLVALVVTSG